MSKNGITSGLVCILSAMERCKNYVYRYDKLTKHSSLQTTSGKCLHYYYYFLDPDFGLCHLRVPTWCPFCLQFYFNGHNWLANQLTKANIDYHLEGNAFVHIGDYEKAQRISDSLNVQELHRIIDRYVSIYCPVANQLCKEGYRWSIMQVEYATDIVFKDSKTVGRIYDNLLNTMVHAVQPEDIAKFLGRKNLHGKNNLEIETSCKNVRHQMRRIKHRMDSSSIKMYDKFSKVLRIETTTNNPQNFSHYRSVEHRDGTKTSKVAPVKKTIYSLNKTLMTIFGDCNKRYLRYIAAFDDPTIGEKRLKRVSSKSRIKNRTYKGFNFFDREDRNIIKSIANGDFILKGFRNKHIREALGNKSSGQVSRIIKRLRVKGVIRKVRNSYRYTLSSLGAKICATALNFKELLCKQQLCYRL